MRSIDNSQDIIDSRDVIARIEELEGDREALSDAIEEAQEARVGYTDPDDLKEKQEALQDARAELEEWDESDDAKELKCLKDLAEEGENECEWESGTALVRESYFEEYARQLAEDLGLLENCDRWPATCIDWEQAARDLKMDYSTVTFKDEDGEGVDYYVRN